MPMQSAGLVVFRKNNDRIEVLLVHPGGPFWSKKDEDAWSIPKGEIEAGEQPLEVARRELMEETGSSVSGNFIQLEPLKQPGGKTVSAWAIQADFNTAVFTSNSFTMEWPPKSGRLQEFPEVDRTEWFSLEEAMRKILKGQQGFITQLQQVLERGDD